MKGFFLTGFIVTLSGASARTFTASSLVLARQEPLSYPFLGRQCMPIHYLVRVQI